MRAILNIFLLSLVLISCSKEENPRVEYQVNSSGSALIAYTMVTPSLRQETVSGSWDVLLDIPKVPMYFFLLSTRELAQQASPFM